MKRSLNLILGGLKFPQTLAKISKNSKLENLYQYALPLITINSNIDENEKTLHISEDTFAIFFGEISPFSNNCNNSNRSSSVFPYKKLK